MIFISTTVVTDIQVPVNWFFRWFLSVELSKIMQRYGPLPAVTQITDQTGPMYTPGSSRVIHFSDGSRAYEETTICSPPRHIVYKVSELTSIFRHLFAEAQGEIWFRDTPRGGTVVEWQYIFYGRNIGAAIVLLPLVKLLWKGFMRSALNQAKHLSEAEWRGF